MTDRDQLVHDWLLEQKPEGAEHDSKLCPFCVAKASVEEEEVSDKTAIFTEEQHEQLLSSAVAKAVAEAQAEADAEVLRLNEELETVKAELAQRDEKIAEFEAATAAREEQDRLDALAVERVAKVKEVAAFTDEQIETRKDSWAKMEEAEFAAYLEDIRAVASASKQPKKENVPPTKFDGTRATAGDDNTETSAVERFFSGGLVAASQ